MSAGGTPEREVGATDRVIAVTGGARGIGAAVCQHALSAGWRVVVLDLDEGAAWWRDPIWSDRPPVLHLSCDVRDPLRCEAAVRDIAANAGRLDALVCSAGINRRASIVETTEEDWRAVLDVNVSGAWRIAKAAHGLLAASRGAVVMLGSTFSQRLLRGFGAYSVSKAAIAHLARVLAMEWADAGIRVNTVAPTLVATELTDEFRSDPQRLEALLATIPLGRMAELHDVVSAVMFLLSDEASMITGQELFVDGGKCST